MKLRSGLLLGAILLTFGSVAHPTKADTRLSGLASYYSQGPKTASGERYNPAALTAAHRTLPFNTCVRVTNLSNGKWVVLRINDRGPYLRGRIIDVSPAAAAALDFVKRGITKVSLTILHETGTGASNTRQTQSCADQITTPTIQAAPINRAGAPNHALVPHLPTPARANADIQLVRSDWTSAGSDLLAIKPERARRAQGGARFADEAANIGPEVRVAYQQAARFGRSDPRPAIGPYPGARASSYAPVGPEAGQDEDEAFLSVGSTRDHPGMACFAA